MRTTTIIALFAVVLMGMAFADDSGNGCKLQGVWVDNGGPGGYLTYMVTYDGTGDKEGTMVLEQINPQIPPWFPNSRWTNARGVWAKTGPNTYDSMNQGYLVERIETDAGPVNQIRLIFLNYATQTLTDCNTMHGESTIDFFTPEGIFLEGYSLYGSDESMHRLLLNQTAPVPQP